MVEGVKTGAASEKKGVDQSKYGCSRVLVVEGDDGIKECLLELLADHATTPLARWTVRRPEQARESRPAPLGHRFGHDDADHGRKDVPRQAASDPGDRVNELSAAAYLTKPLIMNDLLKLVRQHCAETSN